ncbi:MAG: WxcM-like domain-containing protein [Alphaproteobacteria bacterium]|nr:WxcM-like domain-containing protein [Alphaproteobacteria bacterium]
MLLAASNCVIPPTVVVEPGASIGPYVVFVGGQTIVRTHACIEAAAVIGRDITIGQGAQVRPGAVVLRSVPPNAIVEGNPAQIVGYRDGAERGSYQDIIIRDASVFAGTSAPANLPLGIGDSAIYLMRQVADPRGSLTVGEFGKELPFEPRRYFLVYDVPSRELRGEHAHRQCHQFLICINGSCHVLVDDGVRRCEVILDRPDVAVYMPPMIWGTQYRYSKDAILMVFASHHYDAGDYLRTYDEFEAEMAKRSR